MNNPNSIEYYWALKKFKPNPKQKQAILHTDGPLFLTAGPGSGKTRVILWRTVNLIVFHNVDPKRIFLATFAEDVQSAQRTLAGIEIINIIRKNQLKDSRSSWFNTFKSLAA